MELGSEKKICMNVPEFDLYAEGEGANLILTNRCRCRWRRHEKIKDKLVILTFSYAMPNFLKYSSTWKSSIFCLPRYDTVVCFPALVNLIAQSPSALSFGFLMTRATAGKSGCK